jgi:hypothetical protein
LAKGSSWRCLFTPIRRHTPAASSRPTVSPVAARLVHPVFTIAAAGSPCLVYSYGGQTLGDALLYDKIEHGARLRLWVELVRAIQLLHKDGRRLALGPESQQCVVRRCDWKGSPDQPGTNSAYSAEREPELQCAGQTTGQSTTTHSISRAS